MYDLLASFAQTWGLLMFVAFFIGAAVYAFWPKNQQKFEEAARVPLEDDDRPAAAEDGGNKDRSHD
ncbi:cytochrome C oxidase Cbb3 [Leptolyngbya valderiana BDU 20041]|nr:cytochrome C oxidase Cbb3 [Leptolyngbya valderiana BDU 20041]